MKMREKILLMENVPEQVEMLRARLEEEGYEVISAIDGKEGLKKASEEKPDLILLDLIMPKVDGIEVCSRLKEGADTRHIPIIITTAIDSDETKENSLAAGAKDFVTKPYDLEELLTKIRRLLADKPHEY